MTVHLLVARRGREADTRCGEVVKVGTGSIRDAGLSGWRSEVSCPMCLLPKPVREPGRPVPPKKS